MAEARVVLLSGDASLCSGSQQLQPPCQLRVSARLQERLLGLWLAPGEAAGVAGGLWQGHGRYIVLRCGVSALACQDPSTSRIHRQGIVKPST
ncbi:hypothetical protein NHX12_015142 [Muraenolepis orangiensis]|uniref:Uncharacterized protein n=1 Tax=Muraenolepis orangiensis TaxID=630683 RepID=A0A9Q0DAB9_9TELE|nr:hypothetical protein NHX12_015142 [Muraenolepis orangiensis]